jgi:hypothetical protein
MFKDIFNKIEELIKEGNIRKVIINDQDGNTYIEVPLLVAIILTIAAPFVTIIGALAGFAAKFSLEIIKKEIPGELIINEMNEENT